MPTFKHKLFYKFQESGAMEWSYPVDILYYWLQTYVLWEWRLLTYEVKTISLLFITWYGRKRLNRGLIVVSYFARDCFLFMLVLNV